MNISALALAASLVSHAACACSGLDPASKPYIGELTFNLHTGLSNLSISSRAWGMFNVRDCGLEGLEKFRGDGMVKVRPHLILHWEGDATGLVFGARFAEPVLILVHDPDGRWFLDDGHAGAPLLAIENPVVGDYAVYLGTHGATGFTRPGTLIVSELHP